MFTEGFLFELIDMYLTLLNTHLPDSLGVEEVFFQLICIVLFLLQNVIYGCSIPGYINTKSHLQVKQIFKNCV